MMMHLSLFRNLPSENEPKRFSSLDCTSLFLNEFWELIRLAPKVTDFVVGIVYRHDYYPIPEEPVSHSQLRKLTITQLRTQMWDRDDFTINNLFKKNHVARPGVVLLG